MKRKVPYIVLMLLFSTAAAWAKNSCYCHPIPESKTYQGEARKKHIIGYSIDWSCVYDCKDDRPEAPQKSQIKAYYSEYFIRAENGTEGICEGMVYKPEYNFRANNWVYMFHGETYGFKPTSSSSLDLQKWAKANNCD